MQICAAIQALSFVPFVYAALTQHISSVGVLLAASVYWGAGLATGPAWNTWMEQLVPRSLRAGYFAQRTRYSQMAILLAFAGAGFALDWGASHDRVLPVFAILFAGAGILRSISFLMLTRQNETLAETIVPYSFANAFSELRGAGTGRLLTYLVVVQACVQFAGPFFAPYMIEQLHFSYVQFMYLISASFILKVVMLPFYGRHVRRIGAERLLIWAGLGIAPVSALWLVSGHFGWLLVVQFASGAAWAAYELAFFLLFFEAIPKAKRTAVLTLYNLFNTAAWVAGALAGGLVLRTLGLTANSYLVLFALSSVGRLASLMILRRARLATVESAPIAVRTVGLRPSAASIDAVILPALPDQAPEVEAAIS